MNHELAARAATRLSEKMNAPQSLRVMVGLDAFVDEIIRVVDRRISLSEYERVERLSDLSARVSAASGVGTNMELVVERVKLGGNGPIMANALAAFGASVSCIGPMGEPSIHPAFAEIAERARVISIGQPGHTDALEFEDGKLMLGKLETLQDVTWQRLMEKLGEDELTRQICDSDLVALVNWTMLPFMSDIWKEALGMLKKSGTRAFFFFDLADPEKHSDKAIREACLLLSQFQEYGKTVLGLNEKEAFRVGETLGHRGGGHGRANVRAVAAHISAELPIETVVVHPRAYAVTASAGVVTADVEGPFTDSPKISTGAGDHFNAGFCLGKLLEMTDEESAAAAVSTSGYYVRHASSPTFAQLADFLRAQSSGE